MCAEIGSESPLQTRTEWRTEPDIPYKIWCVFNSNDAKLADNSILDKKHPAHFKLTPDLKLNQKTPEYSLSIFFHRSIPEEFLEVVYYHEKTEAAAMYGEHELPQSWSHALAVEKTIPYAKQTLSQDDYLKYQQWLATLDTALPPPVATPRPDTMINMIAAVKAGMSIYVARQIAKREAFENRLYYYQAKPSP